MRGRLPTLVVALGTLAALLPAHASAADAGATLLLSRPSGLGALPSSAVNDSFAGSRTVSTDGRFVAFESFADGLSPDDDDSVLNVYVRDTQTGVTELASRSTGGAGANGDSAQPTISADGSRVAFVSEAGNLDPADPGHDGDVYVYDRGDSHHDPGLPRDDLHRGTRRRDIRPSGAVRR